VTIGDSIFVRNRNSLNKNEQSMRSLACRKLTPNIHSSHDLNRQEAKHFLVKLTNLNIPRNDLVEVFIDLLEAERLRPKNFDDD
jgi:hypothetical protein